MADRATMAPVADYKRTPEYQWATRGFTLSLVAPVAYPVGVYLVQTFGGLALDLALLVAMALLVGSVVCCLVALRQAGRNPRPGAVRRWAFAALAVNVAHATVVVWALVSSLRQLTGGPA